MQNNYYFLSHFVVELKKIILDKLLVECFSQQKDELILGFRSDTDSVYVKASLLPDFACLSVQDDFQRAKKNSVNLFQPIVGASVTDIIQALNERTFVIYFSDYKALYFKMHGNRANILFFDNENIAGLFKKKLVKDHSIALKAIDREIDQSYEAFQKVAGNYAVLFPTFGKIVKHHLAEQGYDSKPIPHQWQMILEVLEKLKQGEYYLVELEGKLALSLIPIGEVLKSFSSAIEAVNQFYIQYQKHFKLSRAKTTLIKQLENQLKKTGNYIQKTQVKLDKLENSRKNDEIANIIMANLHAIPSNVDRVELFDFYQNQTIEIKLKLGLSPQKNAENYYRKGKNQKVETKQLKENIHQKEIMLSAITEQLEEVKCIEDYKTLKGFIKTNANSTNKPEKGLPYRKVNFQGFDILIGKSATSNDELTQRIAKKDDLWLHAKDVSGSHVVVKAAGQQHFPKPVIEFAAALAAFHSKRKNDSLCPVIYTLKKHVRKPKYALPGQVVVEKEQVILIEPQNFVN